MSRILGFRATNIIVDDTCDDSPSPSGVCLPNRPSDLFTKEIDDECIVDIVTPPYLCAYDKILGKFGPVLNVPDYGVCRG